MKMHHLVQFNITAAVMLDFCDFTVAESSIHLPLGVGEVTPLVDSFLIDICLAFSGGA